LAVTISTRSTAGTYEAVYELHLTPKLSRGIVEHVVQVPGNGANPEPPFALQSQTSYGLPVKLHLLKLLSTAFPVRKANRTGRWQAE